MSFDLEKALSGARVWTAEGLHVEGLHRSDATTLSGEVQGVTSEWDADGMDGPIYGDLTTVEPESARTATHYRNLAEEARKHDMVNSPPHYQLMPGVEVIDVREAMLNQIPAGTRFTEVDAWSRATEYLMRMWQKGGLEDAKKARWYLDRLIEEMESD